MAWGQREFGKRREETGISNIVGFKILMTISCVITNISHATPSGSFHHRGSTISNYLKNRQKIRGKDLRQCQSIYKVETRQTI